MPYASGRLLIYWAGGAIGLGHLLFALSLYRTYAQKTGRRFYFTLHGSLFQTDTEPGPGLFLERHFDLRVTGLEASCLDGQQALALVKREVSAADGARLIGHPHRRLAHSFLGCRLPDPDLDGIAFSSFDDVRDALLEGRDLPERVLFVDSIVSARKLKSTDAIRPFAPFAPDSRPVLPGDLEPGRYLGVHVRDGNGEHLNGRVEGGTPAFWEAVGLLATRVRSRSAETRLPVLVLSDNAATAVRVASMTGGVTSDLATLPDEPHAAYVRRDVVRGQAALRAAMRDLRMLSEAAEILGLPSLFASAASLWSTAPRVRSISVEGHFADTRSGVVVPQAPVHAIDREGAVVRKASPDRIGKASRADTRVV